MQIHFPLKSPCCLTRHNGLLAVETLRWILIGVAFSTQQDLIFGSKWFLHQRATAFGTLEAPLMPVTAFVGQILGENKPMLIKTFLYSAFIPQLLPEIKWKGEKHCNDNLESWHQQQAGGVLRSDVSTQHCCVHIFCRSLAEAIRSFFGTGNCPSLCNMRGTFLLEE